MTSYHLVPDTISGDAVEALEELLDDARRGELIGLAFAAMYKRKRYIVNSAGEARRSPTFTSGMVNQLQIYISNKADIADPQ